MNNAQPTGALPADEPQRVVVIDDTADLRDLLRLALIRGGFQVVAEAGDGREGIEAVRTTDPDVVLLDLAMPVMDGIDALPTIRRLCPQATIVVLSGFGAQQMSARAVAAGADGYVQKGAPLGSIIDYVRDVSTGAVRKPSTRALSVVPTASTSAGPASDQLAPESTDRPAARPAPTRMPAPVAEVAGSQVSIAEALAMAPYGVVEVADEPLFRVVHANPTGVRLLGEAKSGTPLAVLSPELASLVSFHRLDADASFETDLEGGRVRATLRRTGWSLLIYLDSTVEDVGLLRRAIATTAHEIRGPVAVLCGVAETLEWFGAAVPVDEHARLLGSVVRQARMLDAITADLLTAAQIQRGTLRIDSQVVEPHVLVDAVVTGRYDVSVVIEDDRSLRADPTRLEQMLSNLLSNAHKYGAAPYTVRVRPHESDPALVSIDVADEGEGVPAEFADHLFREFARAHDAVATGTGLGLYVVRTLARSQGGDVTYAPGVERGSVFTISLPAC